MKPLLYLLALPLSASTIQVSGSGTFSEDNWMQGSANFCIHGEGLSMCANGVGVGTQPPGALYGNSLHNPYMQTGWATVDGIQGAYYALALGGNGEQYVQVMDAQGRSLAKEDVDVEIEITSFEQSGGPQRLANGYINEAWEAKGTFDIVPVLDFEPQHAPKPVTQTPEPGTGTFMLAGYIGLLMIGIWRIR